jgi:hypothetical protein
VSRAYFKIKFTPLAFFVEQNDGFRAKAQSGDASRPLRIIHFMLQIGITITDSGGYAHEPNWKSRAKNDHSEP